MRKWFQSAFYSGLFMLYGGCFYFFFGMLFTMANHGDFSKFVGDFIVSMIVGFVALTFVMYEINGMFEELNKPRNRDENKDPNKKDSDDNDGCPKGQ